MKSGIFRLVGLLIPIVALGCSPPLEEDYFPLADGSRWEYELTFSDASGAESAAHKVVRIDGEEEISGHTYYKRIGVTSESKGSEAGSVKDIEYARVDESGFYVLDAQRRDEGESLLVPLPLSYEQKWVVHSSAVEMECEADRLAALHLNDREYKDSFRVSCSIRPDGANSTEELELVYYFARDVGLVKSVTVGGGMTVQLRLREYIR